MFAIPRSPHADIRTLTNPRRLAPALPFDEDKPSNRCVNLHREHPRPSLFELDFEKVRPRKWPGFTPPRATALCRRSVAYYCTAAYMSAIESQHTRLIRRMPTPSMPPSPLLPRT